MHVTRRGRTLLGATALLLLVAPLTGSAPAAGDDTCANYRATAAADGVRVAYDSPGFILIDHTDVGTPVAQVSIDSFGTATGYAAYPDPGEEALSLVPVAGVSRDLYPLVVESQHPSSPQGRFSSPGVNLLATSSPNAARAVADSGISTSTDLVTGGLIQAKASATCAETGEVTAQSESTVEGLGLSAGALRIARVHSLAKVVVGADGTPTLDASIEVSLVTAGGQTIGVTEDGLVLAGSPVPLAPLGLEQLLAGSNLGITYLAPEPQADGRGITAPGIRISTTQNISGGQPTVLSLTLGRAFAAADAAPVAPTAPGDTGSVDLPVDGGAGSFVPPTGIGTTGTGTTATPDADQGAVARAVPISTTGPFSTWGTYAVLLAGGIVVLSGALLFKKLGVRAGWS